MKSMFTLTLFSLVAGDDITNNNNVLELCGDIITIKIRLTLGHYDEH